VFYCPSDEQQLAPCVLMLDGSWPRARDDPRPPSLILGLWRGDGEAKTKTNASTRYYVA
jgi:hypothetical protein